MCTGIRLKAKDGTAVHARTLEFGVDIHSDIIIIPEGYERVGSTPKKSEKDRALPGKSWKSKYASVGMSALGLDVIVDGVNEKGLAIGLFYFPGTAGYMKYNSSDASKTIGPWEVGSFLLENYANIKEVKDIDTGICSIVVPPVILEKFNPKEAPPVHFVVSDKTGQSIVIEYVDGKVNIHDNPLGVITNSPAFDWHMTNLRNYLNFSFTNAAPMVLGSEEEGLGEVVLNQFGQGSGMVGIPGDFTPPSRFVRAVAYSQSVSNDSPFRAETGEEAVLQAFHLLNNFDIPKGVALDRHEVEKKTAQGNSAHVVHADYTLWTSAVNLAEQKYYFRTYDNSQIRMIDLNAKKELALEKKIKRISISGKEAIQQIS